MMSTYKKIALFAISGFFIASIPMVVFGASSGSGTMSVNPNAVLPSGTGKTFVFDFSNTSSTFSNGSVVVLTIPSGWTVPQNTVSSDPGYFTVAETGFGSNSCNPGTVVVAGSGPWTITVPQTCGNGDHMAITYGAGTNANKVSAPASGGPFTFTTQTRNGSAGSAVNISSSPVITLDSVSPVVTEVTPIQVGITDTTPDYTFNSNEAGVITYGGDCSDSDTSASVGNNTISFNTLSVGTHSNCTIKVTDVAGNQSNILNVSPFTIILPVVYVPVPGNLIQNPSFENGIGDTATSWTNNSWGTSSTTFSRGTIGSHSGGRYAKIVVTNYVDGDAKWLHQSVPATHGDYFTYSEWYKSDVPTEINIIYTTTGGDQFEVLGQQLPPVTEWTQFSSSFFIPTGSAVRVAHIISGNGTLSTDDYALVAVIPPPTFSQGLVTFTFDDGWKSGYENGIRDVLNVKGLKATAYLNTEPIVGGFPGYVSSSDVVAMQYAGNDVSGHTTTHVDLTLPGVNFVTEINNNRAYLQGIASTSPIDTFAYPYGSFNDAIISAVQASGYTGARSVDEGYNFKNTDKFKLKIQHVTNTTTFAQAKAWIDTAVLDHTWLIFMFHKIEPTIATCATGDEECAPKQLLQDIVNYLTTEHVSVLTMHQGLAVMDGGTVPDVVSPSITEVTPIPSSTVDATPDYTFNSTEAGTIIYGGSCTSLQTTAVAGNNTITFSTLTNSSHVDCTVRVKDGGNNLSNTLTLAPFTVNAFTIVITIDPYNTLPTNQDITVTASTVGATLNTTTYTFTANGSFDFVANDTFGNVATSTVTITNIDKTAPTLTVNNLATNNLTPTVTGTTNDTADVIVTINTKTYTVTPITGVWSVTVPVDDTLPEATYAVSVNSTDVAGNVGTGSGVLIISTTAPGLTIDTIAPNASIITGTTAPDSTVVVTVNSVVTPAVVDGAGLWSANIGVVIPDGHYVVSVISTDSLTNTTTVTSNLTIDTTVPVLNLTGASQINLYRGEVFTDPGATALDNIDGDITSHIVVTGTVDTNTVGTTTLTYNVSDTLLHPAVPVSRIVVVSYASDLVVSAEQSVNPSTNSATITWTTTHPATSRVVWGNISVTNASSTEAGTPNYGYTNSTVEDATLVTSHSVTVSGLSSGTQYYFRPVSHGSPEIVGSELSVTTPTPPPTPTPPSGGGGGGGGGNGPILPNLSNKGDANKDGKTNMLDFVILMANWGKTGTSNLADFNLDNKVNVLDFVILMANWQK